MAARKRIQQRTHAGEVFDARLRMLTNASDAVNARRADFVGQVALDSSFRETADDFKYRWDKPGKEAKQPRGKLKSLGNKTRLSVFVDSDELSSVPGVTRRRGKLATAELTPRQAMELRRRGVVRLVEVAQTLEEPTPIDAGRARTSPTLRRVRGRGAGANVHHDGEGVLIGFIDVQGFDFAHPDLVDARGEPRFLAIWDQGGAVRPPPPGFGFGALITQKHMSDAIKASRKLKVPATRLEPQVDMVPGSHGTHVASIAGGAHGVAPRAMLAGVVISRSKNDRERRKSFYDSSRLIHAIEWLVSLAEARKVPLVINISLGTNGHAHDGTSAASRWIDRILARAGRAVVVAAGNAGQRHAAFDGDVGYVLGRIHSEGKFVHAGLRHDLEWIVAGNGQVDVSENELEIWYPPEDRLAVSVRTPSGQWIGPVEPKSYIENKKLADDTFVSIYNELYYPSNGCNRISVFLSPFLHARSPTVGVAAGTWTVRLQAREVRNGRFHAWIERDDPRPTGRNGKHWALPSYFSEQSSVGDYAISSLATGADVIAVANADPINERIHITSSPGPTRDARNKPDIAAPGTDVVAANGFGLEPWTSKTGTSMAAPYVTGVVALMLQVNPNLTGAQLRGIVQRTAQPLPGHDYAWRPSAGYGLLDPVACVVEAKQFDTNKDVTHRARA